MKDERDFPLDSTDEYLKNSLDSIMRGDWDEHFDQEQLEMARKNSFMLNHISISKRDITFEYGETKAVFSYDCDPLDYQIYGSDLKTHLLSEIRQDDAFLKAYASFIRDWKIGTIVGDR